MKRDNGWYWVKFNGKWYIDEWNNDHWENNGAIQMGDEDFEEIDERKIERFAEANQQAANTVLGDVYRQLQDVQLQITMEIGYNSGKPNIGKRGCMARIQKVIDYIKESGHVA